MRASLNMRKPVGGPYPEICETPVFGPLEIFARRFQQWADGVAAEAISMGKRQ